MQTMEEIRDSLLATLEGHEKAAHQGEKCPLNTLDALAYLCHCAGIRPGMVTLLAEHIRVYDRNCQCRFAGRLDGLELPWDGVHRHAMRTDE